MPIFGLGGGGAEGVGVPEGGTAGQVLEKIDGTNFNTQWATRTAGSTTQYKLGTFTRDVSQTTDQVITGVGFQPDFIEFMACINENTPASIGWDNCQASGHYSLYDEDKYADDNYGISEGSESIVIYTAQYVYGSAHVSAVGADGFTLDWSKQGSPTGTAKIVYKAIKL